MSLTIIGRKQWGAKRRRNAVQSRSPSSIRELFIHWPGRPSGSYARSINSLANEYAILRQIQQGHFNNGWSDIGYNHILVPDYIGDGHTPRLYTARGAMYTPAAQLNHNAGTLAIMVLMGPDDRLTSDVRERLRSYVRWADDYAGGRPLVVRCHGDVFSTECPGPALRNWVRTDRHR